MRYKLQLVRLGQRHSFVLLSNIIIFCVRYCQVSNYDEELPAKQSLYFTQVESDISKTLYFYNLLYHNSHTMRKSTHRLILCLACLSVAQLGWAASIKISGASVTIEEADGSAGTSANLGYKDKLKSVPKLDHTQKLKVRLITTSSIIKKGSITSCFLNSSLTLSLIFIAYRYLSQL